MEPFAGKVPWVFWAKDYPKTQVVVHSQTWFTARAKAVTKLSEKHGELINNEKVDWYV